MATLRSRKLRQGDLSIERRTICFSNATTVVWGKLLAILSNILTHQCTKNISLEKYQETNGFFTEYSKSIPSEDMAEVFSHLIQNQYINTNDIILNNKIRFIKDRLNKIDDTFVF